MTDQEIEDAAQAAGGQWDGNVWRFEDADLHPFVRSILAASVASGVHDFASQPSVEESLAALVADQQSRAPVASRAQTEPEYSPVWIDKTPGCAPMYYGIDRSGESCRISPGEHLHSVRLGAKIGNPDAAAPTPTQVAEAPKAVPQAVVGEASDGIRAELMRFARKLSAMARVVNRGVDLDQFDAHTLNTAAITIELACRPSPAPSAAPHQGADALREDAERWRLFRTWEHQAAVVDNDGTTLTFRFDSIDPDGFEDEESKWLDAVADAARAALAQHQPQQGERQ